MRPGLPQRFWSKVDVRSEAECWPWLGAVTSAGYGSFRGLGRTISAHQQAWELYHGTPPARMDLDHRCRNRLCVNPSHLQAVTRKQNGENRVARKGSRSGVRGVSWNRGAWQVRVYHYGKCHNGGRFHDLNSAEGAAIALRARLFTNSLQDREKVIR